VGFYPIPQILFLPPNKGNPRKGVQMKMKVPLVLYAMRTLAIQLLLHLFLDDVPPLFSVGHDALGTVLHARWQGGIVARAVEQEEGAVAEEA